MSARGRTRTIAVVAILAAGALGLIGSTQTWAVATLAEGDLAVPGTTAAPVLPPLMLTALALGLVLTLVGRPLRYALGLVAVAVGVAAAALAAPMIARPAASAVAPAVTERTGLAGEDAVAEAVLGTAATMWPLVTLIAAVVIGAAGLMVLATAHGWTRGGRRYDGSGSAPRSAPGGPLDALDSWDELSRGDDPTR